MACQVTWSHALSQNGCNPGHPIKSAHIGLRLDLMCNTWDKVFFLWYMCEGTLHVRDTCEILLFPAKSVDFCKTENLYFFVQAFSALVKECLLCSPLHLWQQQHTWHWHTLLFLHQCFLLQNVLLEESKKDKPIQCITSAAMPRLDIHSFITYHVRYCTAKVINQRTPILLIWAGTLRREGWVWWWEGYPLEAKTKGKQEDVTNHGQRNNSQLMS